MTAPARLDDTLGALADPTGGPSSFASPRARRGSPTSRPRSRSLNSVSKHIRILERARLVTRRKVGREHLLSRNARPLDEAAAWIHRLRDHWNRRLDRLEKALEEDDTR